MSKFQKGPVIQTLDDLMNQTFVLFENGSFRKVYHIGWVQGWQVRYVWMLLKSGQLFKVIPKET